MSFGWACEAYKVTNERLLAGHAILPGYKLTILVKLSLSSTQH